MDKNDKTFSLALLLYVCYSVFEKKINNFLTLNTCFQVTFTAKVSNASSY